MDPLKPITINDSTTQAELYARIADVITEEQKKKYLGNTNALLHFFNYVHDAPPPRYLDQSLADLNALGFTLPDGPMKGQVVIGKTGALSMANVLGHETLHSRLLTGGLHEVSGLFGGRYAPDALGGSSYRRNLAKRMADLQDDNKSGPYWGAAPSDSAEEQLANIFGYEASLPKGTSILNTNVGNWLFKGAAGKSLRDYYFSQTSQPFGGAWEGQVNEPSSLERIANALRQFWITRGRP